jgi:SAM-dependent methyltransferase
MACGTGILCKILQESGIYADGMDFSAGMIAIARENCPESHFDVADMTTYRPEKQFDLITCTGDAINHIPHLSDVEKIFQNVHAMLAPGGYFVFDILNEDEVSDSEPFEMDHDAHTRVWFQMTCPEQNRVDLNIRVFENGQLQLEETIRETIHDPVRICRLLQKTGFTVDRCANRLLDDCHPSTTWFVIARKP